MAEASLQKVMREGLDRYRASHRLTPHQWPVCRPILDGRPEALGELRLDCDHCGQAVSHDYACRDRHCPRCQRRASQTWCERQQAAVLPVSYHHLVVTVPHDLNPWVQLHPEVIHALLFETVWATLSAFGADPKRLGGQLGMTAVRHTWGPILSQHVPLHGLVPGAPSSPKASGSRPRAPTCFRFGHWRGLSAAASSGVCAGTFRTANSRVSKTWRRSRRCSIP